MNKRRLLSFIITLALMAAVVMTSYAADDIVILYTNDIHTYINNQEGFTYSALAAYRDSFENVILVDAGDHIQGTAYGGMDKGKTITELMNAVRFDVATLGNHEFDYGMEGCMRTVESAAFPYVSCNFYSEETGENVLDSYVIIEKAGKKIAFIGITTPETLTSTTPAYFQNEQGEYIYGIRGGNDGSELYASVQKAIDDAKNAGADYIIGLGHLGVDLSSSPYTSREVISNTAGLDALIDGHSHTVIEGENVADKNGDNVILTQTGSYFGAVGQMTLSDTITTRLVYSADVIPDENVKAIEDAWIAKIDESLGQVIGYSEITFDNYDENGNRLVRRQSTNSGDFAADALYYFFDNMGMDVDVAVMNGGGIRNKAITGELSYIDCKEIHTFGNVACLQTISGQQLLDALEWCVRELKEDGSVEAGGLLHISGAKYSVDLSIPSTVQMDDRGVWTGGPLGEYRVYDVQILDSSTGEYEPLDLNARYNLAGYNYTLRDLGDGYAMFEGAVNVLDYAAEDYMVLAEYIKSFDIGESGLPTITAEDGYSDVRGTGRINFAKKPKTDEPDAPAPDSTTYTVVSGDSLWRIAARHYGSGYKWREIYEANKGIIRNPDLIYVGQELVLP